MIGIVFNGGGSRIAAHAGYTIGPLANVKYDQLFGVSAGSIWASVLGFRGPQVGLQVLAEITSTDQIFVKKDDIALIGDLALRRYPGVPYGYGPLRKLIQKYIVGRPSVPVTISRVHINTGYHQHITANPDGTFETDNDALGKVETIEDFQDAIVCSCIIYPMVDGFIAKNGIDGYADGGYREAGPVKIAMENGCTELHICLTGMFSQDSGANGQDGSIIGGTTNLFLAMANENLLNDVDEVIENQNVTSFFYMGTYQGDSNVFDQVDIQANIKTASQVQPVLRNNLKIID